METNSDKQEATQKLWSFYPLIYLEADWSRQLHDYFELDIRVVQTDAHALGTMREMVEYDSPKFPGAYVFDRDVHWFLAINLGKVAEHVNIYDIGMSFQRQIEESIVSTFLMCLRLIRQTATICPIRFRGELTDSSVTIDASQANRQDYHSPDYEEPPVEWPDSFKDDDLQLLAGLWTAMVRLRNLHRWTDQPFEEAFFADLDKKTNERVAEKLRKHQPNLAKEKVAQVVDALRSAGGDIWKSIYGQAFREVFGESKEEALSERTRIGRALQLFDAGLHLVPLYAFLSACLCLETLFTVDHAELSHKIATRLAKIASMKSDGEPTDKTREGLYRKAKAVYKERGHVVHGSKLIDQVDEKIRKDAFRLCRLSLQQILCTPCLLDRYADPATIDKGGRKVAKVKQLREFLLRLDLGLEEELGM